MARLTNIYTAEKLRFMTIGRRQLPVNSGIHNLEMVMDLKGLCIDNPHIRGKELEEFSRKFHLLSNEELHESLELNFNSFVSILNQCVQCVGCRRRVERLYYQLILTGHPTLHPLIINKMGILTIDEDHMKTPQALGTILYRHHEVLNSQLEMKARNKTRCILHSLDALRAKPFSETWKELWQSMKHSCRDEMCIIETTELHDVLENYLKTHKFCAGCRTKIEKAYKIVVGEIRPKEKGFVAALYSHIKKCPAMKHIHVLTNKIDFLDILIKRAEPEIIGCFSKLRERHAKTLEVAQEEVLTCVGMIMYERFRRANTGLRDDERACQLLAAVGVHALYRSFDMCVEKKQGISNLELLYQEMSRAEKAKEMKREQKKLKKKKKKNDKKNILLNCTDYDDIGNIEEIITVERVRSEFNNKDDFRTDSDINFDVIESDGIDDRMESEEYEHSSCLQSLSQLKESEIKNQKKRKQKQKQGIVTKKLNNNNSLNNINTKNKDKFERQEQKQEQELQEVGKPISTNMKCNNCNSSSMDCLCENDVKESGYGSEPMSHVNSRAYSVLCSSEDTSEGSEVSCSDGFCNHDRNIVEDISRVNANPVDENNCEEKRNNCSAEQQQQQHFNTTTKSLQQLLDDFEDKENQESFYIPQEVVQGYQCQREQVQEQRLKLRKMLRDNFTRLCAHQRQQFGDVSMKNNINNKKRIIS